MRTSAALHFVVDERFTKDEFVASLKAASIEPVLVREGSAGAVVVATAVDEGTVRAVREESRCGLDRLLVVHAGEANLTSEAVWRLLDAGAADVMTWNRSCATAMAARLERWQTVESLVRSPLVAKNLVGASRAWIQLMRQIVEVARFTDASVLLLGESGTGKELAARLVHTLDARKDKADLVVLDCTTLVPSLAGSELFGHERGAYTGAAAQRDGAFAQADGGSLFLDELGELPAELQAQLLRAVQERAYKRVGGNHWQSTNFRLISATNRDLRMEIDRGRFRRDLYHRLNGWVFHLPPLRERPEDLSFLIDHFVACFSDGDPPQVDDAVREFLVSRSYPGNIRELSQLIYRICRRHVGPGPITIGDIPEDERQRDPAAMDWRLGHFDTGVRQAVARGVGLREIGRAAEELAVDIVVGEERGSLQRAAQRLGVTDRALQMRRASHK